MEITPELVRTIGEIFGPQGVLWATLCAILFLALVIVTRFAMRLLQRDMERTDKYAERYRNDTVQMIDALNKHTASMQALTQALHLTRHQ